MRSRPLPPADRLHTGRSYGSWRDGVSSGRWRRTERRPPRTFRKRRGTWLGVPRYTARSAGSGLYPGMPRPRTTAAGLNRYGIEYATVPHAIERIGGGDHGGWLGCRLTTRSQRGHGDLSRVAIAGGEKDAEQQSVNAH